MINICKDPGINANLNILAGKVLDLIAEGKTQEAKALIKKINENSKKIITERNAFKNRKAKPLKITKITGTKRKILERMKKLGRISVGEKTSA
jgi:hypothetical protein